MKQYQLKNTLLGKHKNKIYGTVLTQNRTGIVITINQTTNGAWSQVHMKMSIIIFYSI